MEIFKYQAAGNDFILIRSLQETAELAPEKVIHLCDRRFGIGADGLIIMEGSIRHDFSMRFYNNDGSSGMMCGNGGRCIVDLAARSGIKASGRDGSWTFEAPDGIHEGRILSMDGKHSEVRLGMNDVSNVKTVTLPCAPGQECTAYHMNTGTEHLVIFKDSLDGLDILTEGRKWRYSPLFAPGGVNVNFVQVCGDGTLRVRTYERGVEYETLSCGTGIIASAIASWLRGDHSGKYTLRSTMHTFEVSFSHRSGKFCDIVIDGPVEQVFQAIL